MKRKGARKGTVNKYLKVFNEIKNRCDNEIEFSLNGVTREYRASNSLCTFLTKNNIIYKNEYNNYSWNEKIPVTKKLIMAYMDYTYEINKNITLRRDKQTKLPFTDLQYFDNKEEKTTVIYQNKEKEFTKNNPIKQNTKQKPEPQEIGLIRRFIRWIY